MKDQGLLADQGTNEQHAELIRLVKNSIGKISVIHRHAEAMLSAIAEWRAPPEPVDEKNRQAWDDLHGLNITTQRWSDGLMVFTRLGGTRLAEQINGLYSQFCLAGAMELLWGKARNFIEEEHAAHTKSRSDKLASRYGRLAAYFDSHPLPSKRDIRGKK